MIAERDPSLRPIALPPDGLVSDKDADIGNAIAQIVFAPVRPASERGDPGTSV